ncbi:MAG: YncE family protein [Paludibacteraceae bacterium]|nr:YncE family protein [Paludibacteraceae bacterium]
MKTTYRKKIIPLTILAAINLCIGCRHADVVQDTPVELNDSSAAVLYILNEGNMGSNKATIDLYDIAADSIIRDIYPRMNPNVVKELGDVGNDIAVYGNKMYIIVNVSGKIEVTDLRCRRIGQIEVPNCRNITFAAGYAYVSSYAGPVDYNNPEYKQLGYVAKIDTTTLAVVATCTVGYQPNGVAIAGDMLYVANSGGYMAPRYDSTVSVISLDSFEETQRLTVAQNLESIIYDSIHNTLFISSQGNYNTLPAELYRLDLTSGNLQGLGFAATKMYLCRQKLYFYSGDMLTGNNISYGYLSIETLQRTPITLSNSAEIRMPYSIYVDEESEDIYLTDARDYVTPGVLYRYDKNGTLVSKHRTGDIPGHIIKVK